MMVICSCQLEKDEDESYVIVIYASSNYMVNYIVPYFGFYDCSSSA